MQIQQLFQIQDELDQKIIENHHLQNEDLLPAKMLALQTEVAELANETRCFKYWSLKDPSPRKVILEEYVDGLHFALSIGLDKGFQKLVEPELKAVTKTALECFSQVFEHISLFSKNQTLTKYQELFQAMVDLGQVLGFSWREIEQAYLEKNEINHIRQAEGY